MQIGSFFHSVLKVQETDFFLKELINMRQTRSKFLRLSDCAFTFLTGITQTLKMVNFLLFNSSRADFL